MTDRFFVCVAKDDLLSVIRTTPQSIGSHVAARHGINLKHALASGLVEIHDRAWMEGQFHKAVVDAAGPSLMARQLIQGIDGQDGAGHEGRE